jgi:carboxypeptidase Taq
LTAYQKLADRFQQLSRLDHAATYLSWDQMVMMPPNGNQLRSASLAEIAGIRHGLLTASELQDWLDAADAELADLEPAQQASQGRSLHEMRRRWRESNCLPADLVKAKIMAGSHCEHGWRTQRGDNDWSGFLANFREVLKLSREEAQLRAEAANGEFATPYEALLDLHCAGDKQQMIDDLFNGLRQQLPELLQQVMEKQASRPAQSMQGVYPVAEQKSLSEALMAALGFDFNEGRLDVSMHPFSTGESGDLRITTRYSENEFAEAMLATAHETGHASYEGGLPAQWRGLPVGQHRNMSIHESQSLLFEKQLFLSRAFTEYFTATVHRELPAASQFGADDLWRAYTVVEPGYIRVEADEVSYPLHVMLRYEIESALINGDAEADAIPDMWHERMQSYLGLSTKDDYTRGCMQDIHWTDGAFGYFPSYTLGALNGAQLFATIRSQYPDWQQSLRSGDVAFVREWLADNIWSQGCLHDSQQLMINATGEGTNAEYFLQHLRARYLNEEY